MADEYIVEMRHVTKRFPGIIAWHQKGGDLRPAGRKRRRQVYSDEHALRDVRA